MKIGMEFVEEQLIQANQTRLIIGRICEVRTSKDYILSDGLVDASHDKALVASGAIASIGVLGSHFAGDFFLGIDIMVTAMMVNFGLMCLTLLTLPRVNPALAAQVTALPGQWQQWLVGGTGLLLLTGFLIIHVTKDLSKDVAAWYFHSTWVWLLVMTLGSGIYFFRRAALVRDGVDLSGRFSRLPEN